MLCSLPRLTCAQALTVHRQSDMVMTDVDVAPPAPLPCASPARSSLPLVAPLPPAADGHLSIYVTANRLNMTLRCAPPSSLEILAACASIHTRSGEQDAEFHLHYEQDPHWRVDPVAAAGLWRRTTEPQPVPDVYLNILVTPQQEPVLKAKNISGMALTPPVPPEIEWSVRFFGAAQAGPYVTARCGQQGPEATLFLDNSEVLWSTNPGVDKFAFDKCLRALEAYQKPVQPRRAAPAIPSSRPPF